MSFSAEGKWDVMFLNFTKKIGKFFMSLIIQVERGMSTKLKESRLDITA